MIDLHLHTTASDGLLAPAELVSRAATAGLTVMSVTDHDTVASLAECRRAATPAGITLIDGLEMTAVHERRDVHILGYFVDPASRGLAVFLQAQRDRRVDRVREIGARLTALGIAVDIDALIAAAAERPGSSVGRPAIAAALVAAGHVATVGEAFERYLADGQPAFVPRIGRSPAEVVDMIHRARGIASMAHPGVTRQPALMRSLVDEGLDAIEVFHSDHTPEVVEDLRSFARRHNLLMTGGSDFHGDESRRRPIGGVVLPPDEFERLRSAAERRRSH